MTDFYGDKDKMDRSRMIGDDEMMGGGTLRGPSRPTDIGRDEGGEFERPETAPDVEPAPIARDRESGRFGIDPFDFTAGGVGRSVSLLGGSEQSQRRESTSKEREQFNFPAWTVSRAGTYLNKKVNFEGRDDLEPLRERVNSARGQEGQIELNREEYDDFQRVVREGAESELESLEGREANIFGDAEEQREIAREAKQGIINNPPSRLL
jgi:hypothetical protein